jgi:Phox homology (PX) domain protein
LKEKIAKQDRAIIPELPNKGKYSLATRGDPRVIEYRRNALERYLQKVLNNPVLGQIAYVQEFIRKKP